MATGSFDAQATYGAAAETYEEASRRYWSFSAERTVQRLGLVPGMRVLDVACGTGTSAIPAAIAVGSAGSVLAVDYAEPMLDIARRKCAELGIDNIEFRIADMTRLDLPAASFDAVVCVLGIFFVDDMVGLARDLWKFVRPGGRLAITTLGPRVFTPLIDEWRVVLAEMRNDEAVTLPWERTDDAEVLAEILADAGISGADVFREENPLRLVEPEDAWKLVMGTGLRAATTALGPEAETVRMRLDAWVEEAGVTEVVLDVIYASAVKPADG